MQIGIWGWVLFNAFIASMLLLDLFVVQRESHALKAREATMWSALWIALALLFNAALYAWGGAQAGIEFFTGYLIEKSLSLDNIFVIVIIFTFFGVEARYQHRVLFWGVAGALVMRGLFIGIGALVLQRWHWVIYLFGALLLFTGIRMALKKDAPPDVERNPVARLARRLVPMTQEYQGQHFFVRQNGRRLATPLLLVLLLVEVSDLLFAVDSIPAVLAITRDPFIVYTSNAFAVLGLRSLYLLLASVMHRFHYLKYGLSAILLFVGVKMLLMDIYEIPTMASLAVIATLVAASVFFSLRFSPQSSRKGMTGPHEPFPPAVPPEHDGDATSEPGSATGFREGSPVHPVRPIRELPRHRGSQRGPIAAVRYGRRRVGSSALLRVVLRSSRT